MEIPAAVASAASLAARACAFFQGAALVRNTHVQVQPFLKKFNSQCAHFSHLLPSRKRPTWKRVPTKKPSCRKWRGFYYAICSVSAAPGIVACPRGMSAGITNIAATSNNRRRIYRTFAGMRIFRLFRIMLVNTTRPVQVPVNWQFNNFRSHTCPHVAGLARQHVPHGPNYQKFSWFPLGDWETFCVTRTRWEPMGLLRVVIFEMQ